MREECEVICKDKLAEKTDENRELEAKLEDSNVANADLKQRCEELKQELDAAMVQVLQVKRELIQVVGTSKDIDRLTEEVVVLKEKIGLKDASITALEDETIRMKETNKRKDQDTYSLQEYKKSQEILALEDELTRVKENNDKKDQDIVDLEERVSRIRNEANKAEIDLQQQLREARVGYRENNGQLDKCKVQTTSFTSIVRA